MGNQLAAPSKPGAEHSGELQNMVVKETMGGGRLLKTLLCLHDNGGLVVVKVFYKRKDTTSLAPYKQQLEAVRSALLGLPCPHVWPMQTWWETPNAAYMLRQHFFANLYDRLSTRPFLTPLEKRWMTFQLLHALSQAHAHGVCHGDIKAENVMVTSWNWVLLADFASYKPTYLPADNPADFSYYFDTGGRRRCYLAPERFFEGPPGALNTAAPLTPEMDVFSLGCVIAELWLGEGRAFLDLSRLLAYRRGEYDPAAALEGAVAPDIAELVMHMIQRSPGDRWSADHYLTSWPRQLFSPHFSEVLHPFFASLLDADPDARLAAVAAHFDELSAALHGQAGGDIGGGAAAADWGAAGSAAAGSRQQQVGDSSMLPASGDAAASGQQQQQQQAAAGLVPSMKAAAVCGIVPGAAAAAGSSLLAEVDSLLAGVSGAQRRLGGHAGSAAGGGGDGLGAMSAEDDGICIDDAQQLDAAAGDGSRPRSGAEGLAPAAAQQVAAAEWYEYQTRDASQAWVPHSSAGTSSRESVALPGEGGWQWAGPWQVAATAGGAEAAADGSSAGWVYAEALAAPDIGAVTQQRLNWLPVAALDSRLRRRKWVRLRTQAEAAAALAALQQGRGGGSSWRQGQDQGMVLLAVLLCTLLRSSKLQESKRVAISLLCRAALQCDDGVRLQTVVPYLLTQLADPHAAVRTLALGCVVRVMASLPQLPPADAKVYHDYLLPSLSLLPNDPEESVRVAYAQAIADLAAAAHAQLLTMQYGHAGLTAQGQQQQQQQPGQAASSEGGAGAAAAAPAAEIDAAGIAPAGGEAAGNVSGQQQSQPVVRYDVEMAAVRACVERVVLELVTGLRSSPDIKRGLLSHAHQLGLFFGRREIIDQLLPLLITCLNDQYEWRLRGSFFGAIAAVGPHTGHLDAFLLPCLEQALQDSEPAVVCDAVRCLADVCAHLPKRSLLKAAKQVAPLLQHRAPAVRHAAVAFIAAVARALAPADVYTQLAVMVASQLQQQPLLLSDEEHLAACLYPVGPAPQQQRRTSGARPSQGVQQQQQQRRVTTDGPPQAGTGVGAGRSHAGVLGSLLTQPAEAAVLRHSLSERPSSSGSSSSRGNSAAGGGLPAAAAALGSAAPHRAGAGPLVPDVHLDGSALLLRPSSAPIYCLDLDPAAIGGVGVSAAADAVASADAGGTGQAEPSDLPGFSGSSSSSVAAGVAGIGCRCGYRADGFGPSPVAVAAAAARVGGAAGTAAAASGAFWPQSRSAFPSSSSPQGMVTGANTQLALGLGGMVIAPSGPASGLGLRPRPKSSHTAAVDSIARRRAVLQEHYNALVEAYARDPSSMEAGERQQMERLATTLRRLDMQPGHDVRSPAALLTYKMAAITSRVGPTGPSPGGPGDAASAVPAVYDAVSAAITTGIGQHLPGSGAREAAAGGPSWRPRGVLASHLHEHRAAVNCLATSNNGALLLSGSDDETVKVWDVRRLERDVSFASRLTYAGQSGRITGVCPVLDGASVASASSSGSLHVWRVEYISKAGGWAPDKYRGITALRQVSPGEGAILHVLPWANHPALLLYASQRGGVHCCDLRCARDAWHVPPAPSLGLVEQVVADPSGQHWLAQGSSRGWVCLWDVRFLLCVNSWQLPQRCAIQAMAAAVAAPPRLGLAQNRMPCAGVPLLYISAGRQEVGVWDVLDGHCHQVLRVVSRDDVMHGRAEPPVALLAPPPLAAQVPTGVCALDAERCPSRYVGGLSAQTQPAGVSRLCDELNAHMAIDEINTPQARLGVTALLPTSSGAVLTGGADRCIRFWEPSWPERSYIVAGPVWPDNTAIMDSSTSKLQVPGHVYRYTKTICDGVPLVEESNVGVAPQLITPESSPDLASKLRMHDLAHVDSITQLLSVEGSSRLLLSAGRDGCVKVWK